MPVYLRFVHRKHIQYPNTKLNLLPKLIPTHRRAPRPNIQPKPIELTDKRTKQ